MVPISRVFCVLKGLRQVSDENPPIQAIRNAKHLLTNLFHDAD